MIVQLDRLILALTDMQLEAFVREWVARKPEYLEVERFTGPGDIGMSSAFCRKIAMKVHGTIINASNTGGICQRKSVFENSAKFFITAIAVSSLSHQDISLLHLVG
jgi:hypothetical protein